MKIITGLGRCGTSILIKYLHEVGFNLGHNIAWHREVNAGFELSSFYTIVDWMYESNLKKGNPINLNNPMQGNYWKGSSYKEAITTFDTDKKQCKKSNKIDVVKDPRITWHPDLIQALWDCRKDFKLIICHRKPENVLRSRNNLPDRFEDPKPRTELNHYKIDFCDFYTRVLELEIPHIILYFPNFLKNYDQTYDKLNSIGLKFDKEKGKKKWDELIDRSLLRNG